EAEEFLTFENLTAPKGRLPLNTSGGNLAECYMHGLELQLEAVRQIRGTSTNQVPDAPVSMVCSGPMVTPVSSVIFGSEATVSLAPRTCPPTCRSRCPKRMASTRPTGKGRGAASSRSSAARTATHGSGGRSGCVIDAARSAWDGKRSRAAAESTAG